MRLAGVTPSEKSPADAGCTTSVAPVLWVSAPLVPVIVIGKLPVAAVGVVVIVSVEVEPTELTEAGVKLAGRPGRQAARPRG